MKDCDGYYNVIETKASGESAAKAAARWQNRENKAVEAERNRLKKLEKSS